MKRFFLIPLLVLGILAAGCTCTMRGSATVPTKAPSASPTMKATQSPTLTPTLQPSLAPETAAPVAPTPDASSTPDATIGN